MVRVLHPSTVLYKVHVLVLNYIVVLGVTGTGKTTFGSLCIGEPYEDLESNLLLTYVRA